ncbi:MAG: homoserine kinase [Cyanobacteria bacterium P01_H01_bin.119]
MAVPDAFLVTVPATTANIGPGFDCLGAALKLYNGFQFLVVDRDPGTVEITVTGRDAERVSTQADNLAYQAFARLFKHLQRDIPAIQLEIELAVPLSRGLGSSSTAIVGGLLGANAIAGHPLSLEAIADLAIAMEGHPDNVVPALRGGCRLAVKDDSDRWVLCDIPWHRSIQAVVAIPEFELSTAAARQVVPNQYSKADAIFNMANLGLLLRGLETGYGPWLMTALRDRIHQPYRQALIPGFSKVQQAAQRAGAYGLVISGAGPTVLALTSEANAHAVCKVILSTWKSEPFAASAQILEIERNGAIAVPI